MSETLKDCLRFIAEKHRDHSLITTAIAKSAINEMVRLELDLAEAYLALDAAAELDRNRLEGHWQAIDKARTFAERYQLGERRRN